MNLSNSRIEIKQRCDRLFRYQYIDGYIPAVTTPELRFGDLAHNTMEAYWGGSPKPIGDIDPDTRTRLASMIIGYGERWSDADRASTVLGVEVPFSIDLGEFSDGEPLQFVGRMDAVIETAGSVYVVEHKTTGGDIAPGATYWDRLRLNKQIGSYIIACRELYGRECAGVIYDVIRRPPERILATPEHRRRFTKAGAMYKNQRLDDEPMNEFGKRCLSEVRADLEGYYQRRLEVRLEEETAEHRQLIIDVAKQIRFSASESCYPKNSQACGMLGRRCDFFAVCCGEDTLLNRAKFVRRSERQSQGVSQ